MPPKRPLLVFLAATLLVTACRQQAAQPTDLPPREKNAANWRVIDSAIRQLRTGDIALRTGADATSQMLRQMNLTNKTYSHCGLVLLEGGYPFVYHAIGGEDNPDARLMRDSAQNFFHPQWNIRIGAARLHLDAAQLASLQKIVVATWQARPLFDMDFDLKSNDKLYCAEFVYKSVCRAAQDTAYFPTTTLADMVYVGVDNLYDNPHAKQICDYQFK